MLNIRLCVISQSFTQVVHSVLLFCNLSKLFLKYIYAGNHEHINMYLIVIIITYCSLVFCFFKNEEYNCCLNESYGCTLFGMKQSKYIVRVKSGEGKNTRLIKAPFSHMGSVLQTRPHDEHHNINISSVHRTGLYLQNTLGYLIFQDLLFQLSNIRKCHCIRWCG